MVLVLQEIGGRDGSRLAGQGPKQTIPSLRAMESVELLSVTKLPYFNPRKNATISSTSSSSSWKSFMDVLGMTFSGDLIR